ncbi:MAG: hypothetical protein ACK5NA_03625 [Enterococcus sp.]
MEEKIPKAVHATNAANLLKIEFDNGETRYIKSSWVQEILDGFALKKGKKRNLLLVGKNMWLGTEIEIDIHGNLIVNGTDVYTPEELWKKSKKHVHEL